MKHAELQELPVVDGFRQRGTDMTRIETFTDAAFAFALTLLVISFDNLPSNRSEFLEALKQIPVFACCFAQIGIFWYGHHVWSRRYGLDDFPTVMLSFFLVFVTLIFVFPLRVVFSGFLYWLTMGFVPFQLGGDGSDALLALRDAFLTFGLSFLFMSSGIALLYRHAWKRRELLGLDEVEKRVTRVDGVAWAVVAAFGLMGALLALVLPAKYVGYSGFTYALIGPVTALIGRRMMRAQPAPS